MSVTGVLLMYQRQVTNWFDRDPRAASPRARAARLPMETVLAGIYSQKGATPSGDQGSQPRHACLDWHLARLRPSSSFLSKACKGANAGQRARQGLCNERGIRALCKPRASFQRACTNSYF